MPFVSSSSDSRWHPCSRHTWRIRPSHGTQTYWWCSQLSCVLPGRWPSVFFLLAMHNQTSFGSALASFVSCRGSSGCGCYGQDTMSHWPKKIRVTGWVSKRLHDDVLRRPNKLFTFVAFFIKEVTMKTAEERYEETWNSYLELPFFDTSKKAYKMPYKTFSAIMSGICLKSPRLQTRWQALRCFSSKRERRRKTS